MDTKTEEKKIKNILLIEDDIQIQTSLKLALEYEGYNVFTANDGRDGLDKLKKIPTPGLILLDLLMPVMNGWEFLEVINNDIMLSSIPVVVVSGVTDKGQTPINAECIEKPINLNLLLKTVQKYY